MSEQVCDLLEVLEERLGALLAESGDGWTQRVRLAFPDGSPLAEPDDLEATVADLMSGSRWIEAVSNAVMEDPTSASGSISQPPSPSAASPSTGSPSRKSSRADSRANRELEVRLGKLREAKHLPLAASRSARGQRQEPLGHPPPAAAVSSAEPPPLTNPELRCLPGQGLPDPVAAEAPAVAFPPGGDLVARAHGGKVLMASSLDMAHPAENIIDGSEATYWISTGLYPQEILLELCHPSKVSGVRLSSTNVRSVRIEACSEDAAVSFRTLVQGELDGRAGQLQLQELKCAEEQPKPTRFIKTMILSGWNDFCSVHRIVVF